MIIYLYGSDSLRRGRKLQALLKEYRSRARESDVFFADFEENPDAWKDVRDFLLQPSLFNVTKVAVISEATSIKEKDWIAFLKEERVTERRFLLLSDSRAPQAAFRFLLSDPVRFQEFSELEGSFLSRFFKGECRAQNVRLTPECERTVLRILSCASDRSWRITHLVSQLSHLQGAGRSASPAILEELLHVAEREEMFQIARQLLSARQFPSRLALLESALAAGDPAYAFNSLSFQARGEALRAFGEYDISIKSGGLEYEEALTDFIL